MPYIALQLVGIQVVIGALGVSGTGCADLPLIIAFVVLAAFTYSSGLRAPASIAIVKDILIYITAFAAIIVIPIELGGFGKIFAAVPPAEAAARGARSQYHRRLRRYATLALGSALALFLYPHSLTGILSASSGHAIRRNAAMLPGYSFMLGLLALFGFFAIAAGVGQAARVRRRLQAVRQQLRGAGAAAAQFSVLVRRHRLRRDRHRRAGAGGDHVDRRGQSLHAQHPPRIHQPQSDRQGRKRRWPNGCR
jgi:Na+/proline symporter